MRICIYLLVLAVVLCVVSSQSQRNRNNNRNNNNNNNNRLRNGRQQQNRRPNNRRPNRNQNGNRRPKAGGNRGGGCKGGRFEPNHSYQGQDFLVSWRVGCSKFTQSEGEAFCRANRMRAISLDSPAKEREFLGLIAKDRQRYFWTGGKVNNGNGIKWPSGKRYNDVNWSNTGGAKRPQPDNREGDEFCLAVLNNFYADGIRFHDVSCHHRKPIICES